MPDIYTISKVCTCTLQQSITFGCKMNPYQLRNQAPGYAIKRCSTTRMRFSLLKRSRPRQN